MFEVIIFFYLIVVGAFFIEIGTEWKVFRKKKFVLVIATVLGIGWFTIFYGSFVEPRMLVVRQESISLSDEPTQTLKAVVAADIHLGPYRKEHWAKEVADKIMDQHPDIIFLPGDFIFRKPEEIEMFEPFKELSAPYGVYAVTGNHDYEGNDVRYVVDSLKRLGIQVLENDRDRITVGDKEVVIAGVSDIWYDGNTHKTLAGVDEAETVILLAHNPDAVMFPNADRADLVISGHTHGGQIRLPWIGSLAQVPTELGNEYDKGLFAYRNQLLFITAGVGETGPRARLFDPPEINVLTISL